MSCHEASSAPEGPATTDSVTRDPVGLIDMAVTSWEDRRGEPFPPV